MSELVMPTATGYQATSSSLETLTGKVNDILDNSILNDHSFHTPTYRERAANYELTTLKGALDEYLSAQRYVQSVNESVVDAQLKDQLANNEHVRTLEEAAIKAEYEASISKGKDVRSILKEWGKTLIKIGGEIAVPLILSIK